MSEDEPSLKQKREWGWHTPDTEEEGDMSDDVVAAIEQVEEAVARVEQAVKGKWSTPMVLGWMLCGAIVWNLPGMIWHTKWRYELQHGVSSEKVIVETRPHDCDFLAVPLGEKYCYYEREVSTIRWARTADGNPIVSYDEGKTWSVFTPDSGVTVPRPPTVQEVHISWQKVDE